MSNPTSARKIKMFLQLSDQAAAQHGIDTSDLLTAELEAADVGDFQTAINSMKAIKAQLEAERDTWQETADELFEERGQLWERLADDEVPF